MYSTACLLSAGRASFCSVILQDRFVQAQLGDQFLEPCILILQLLEFAHLVRLQPGLGVDLRHWQTANFGRMRLRSYCSANCTEPAWAGSVITGEHAYE